jgi:hypothetical protein
VRQVDAAPAVLLLLALQASDKAFTAPRHVSIQASFSRGRRRRG